MKNKNSAVLLAVSVLLLTALASAGTVTFTTSGTFSSSGTNISKGGISFAGSVVCVASCTTPNQVSLGTFTGFGSRNKTTSDTFTLTISQTKPAGGPGSLVATITGHVEISKKGKYSSNAKVTFNSANQIITLAGVTYTITTPSFNIGILGNADIQANIVSTPEPSASLLLGLAYLGLLGIGFVSRGWTVDA